MAWGVLFREDFTGAAGTTISGWVPTTDVVGKKWYVPDGSNVAGAAQLDGAGYAVMATDPATLYFDFNPDVMATRTGSPAALPFQWYPYATAPKIVALEVQYIVPAITAAVTTPGYGCRVSCFLDLLFADPTTGFDMDSSAGLASVDFQDRSVVDPGTSSFHGDTYSETWNADNAVTTDGGTTFPTYGAGPFTVTLRVERNGNSIKCYRNGTLIHNYTATATSAPLAAHRLVTGRVGIAPQVYNGADEPQSVAFSPKINYILIEADTTELASFSPGGGTNANAPSATLTSTATLTAGNVSTGSTAPGATLVATATLTEGAATAVNPGSITAPAATLTAAATVVGGNASGLPYDPSGKALLYDVFTGLIDTTPAFAQGGMTWGADGNMPAGSDGSTYYTHATTALKRAVLYAGIGTWDFRYDPSAAISGFSQTVPANGLKTSSVIASMAVVPWAPYRLRSDLNERGVAQMLFMLDGPDGMQWVRVTLTTESVLDVGVNAGVAKVSMSDNVFGYPPELVSLPFTLTAEQRLVFQARVSGPVISLYLDGVLLGGARISAPVTHVHAVGVEITNYNDVHYFSLEDVASPQLAWGATKGLYECA